MNQFTPLYIFSAKEGDTLCLPKITTSFVSGGDTSFCFVIDSVRTVDYGGALLRTWYTRSFEQESSSAIPFSCNWGYANEINGAWVNLGRYAERIGGCGSGVAGLFPEFTQHNADGVIKEGFPSGILHCYEDTAIHIKVTTSDCDEVGTPYLGINKEDKDKRNFIKIFPNPAREMVTIRAEKPLPINTVISLYDCFGRVVAQSTVVTPTEVHLNTTHLPSGIYRIRLESPGAIYTHTLVVRH